MADEKVQDAVVVGGGPAGSFFAYELAKRGFGVSVFEEHGEVGVPSHCAGHLSIRSLRARGLYPLPEGIVENTFSIANFYSPSGRRFSVHLNSPVTCAVNRERFDKYLAAKAQQAGAQYSLGSRVQSLVINAGCAQGINVVQDNHAEEQIPARLVVDAEGISSRILRQAGLTPLRGDRLVYAVQAEVEGADGMEEHAVEVYLGREYAPSFYAWLIPRLDGTAKLGLATCQGNPKTFLQRLMQKHPVASGQLRKAQVKSVAFHAIPLGGPIPKAYADGFLAVGDCASQVKPTTGGGVVFGVTCARIAAEVASGALKKGDVSEGTLRMYQRLFMEALGFDLGVMLRARRALDKFSDRKLDSIIRFAANVGLSDALRDVDEIDLQGRTLLTVLRKPAAFASLAYLLAAYLFAGV
ncbi:MAG: geranylgeranyl reductase family protein [Candidatus Bathyarchaeia archaeon]